MLKQDKRTKSLKSDEIIPLIFDAVFTRILNNEDNIIILENILSIYFKEPLENYKNKIKIKSRDLPTENKREHDKQVDLVIDRDGEKTNIELNTSKSEGKTNRNVVYISSIHGKQLKYKDNNYSNIKSTVQINFNDFSCNEENIIDTYYLRNKKGKILTKKFRIDQVDLVKAREKEYNESDKKLIKILRALNATTLTDLKKEIEGTMEKEAENKLVDQIEKYSQDDEVYALYSAYSKEELERNTLLIEAKEEGFKKGIEEGLEQGIEQTAKKMLEKNMSIKDIVDITGLSEKEITLLKK